MQTLVIQGVGNKEALAAYRLAEQASYAANAVLDQAYSTANNTANLIIEATSNAILTISNSAANMANNLSINVDGGQY